MSSGRDGVGTITFGPTSAIDIWYSNTGMEMFGFPWVNTLAFYDVPDVAGVARMIGERQRSAAAS